MPSKARWSLNPKKWFDTISNTTPKRDKNDIATPQSLPSSMTLIRTMSLSSNIALLPRKISRSKITPLITSNDGNNNNNNNAPNSSFISQFQLPAFSIRRERTSILLPSTSVNRQTTFLPNHTEPTIRRNGRCEEKLSINSKRSLIQPISSNFDASKKENLQQTTAMELSIFNMSRRCLVDYPRHSPISVPIPITIQESRLSTNYSKESSLIDDDDNSSSNEMFNDEDQQYTVSKDALLISDVISVKSLTDSQTSLNRFNSRPIIYHYEKPVDDSQITDDKSEQQQTSSTSSPQSEMVEDVLDDTETVSTTERTQSSVNIITKIENHIRISQSPTVTLEKPEFVRITNASYRLTIDKDNHVSNYRRNGVDSFIGCTNSEDSLRPANDEECYATLPRGSSTEHINKTIQNDLRTIVDGCIRPMVTSIGSNRLPKNQHRSKRSLISNNNTKLIIEDITDKLLSSIDYPIYTQHQRCC